MTASDDKFRPVDVEDLPRGISYLTVSAAPGGVVVRVRSCAGEETDHRLPVALDESAAQRALASVIRPLSVTVLRFRAGYGCTLLGTSADGPRRVQVSLGGALELTRRGVHSVLRCDLALAS